MEKIYSGFKGRRMAPELLLSMVEDKRIISKSVDEAIIEIIHGGNDNSLSGTAAITAGIVSGYIQLILRHDAALENLVITDLEKEIATTVEVNYNGNPVQLKIGGVIDRMDNVAGIQRIVDYKTGSIGMEINSVNSLFDAGNEHRNEAWFQVLMYCEINAFAGGSDKLQPVIYALRNLNSSGFSGKLSVGDTRESKRLIGVYSEVRDEYSRLLKQVLESIFDRHEPFEMTEHRRKCDYCPYRELCKR